MNTENKKRICEVIDLYGGAAALARRLKLSESSGRAVVHSWKVRGVVPSWVLIKHPAIFKGCKDSRTIRDEEISARVRLARAR